MHRSRTTLRMALKRNETSPNLSFQPQSSSNLPALSLSTEISADNLPKKHRRTATEKYYLHIIATMKSEIDGLMKIIKAKDWEIEQLRKSKIDLKAENVHIKSLIGLKKVQIKTKVQVTQAKTRHWMRRKSDNA